MYLRCRCCGDRSARALHVQARFSALEGFQNVTHVTTQSKLNQHQCLVLMVMMVMMTMQESTNMHAIELVRVLMIELRANLFLGG